MTSECHLSSLTAEVRSTVGCSYGTKQSVPQKQLVLWCIKQSGLFLVLAELNVVTADGGFPFLPFAFSLIQQTIKGVM